MHISANALSWILYFLGGISSACAIAVCDEGETKSFLDDPVGRALYVFLCIIWPIVIIGFIIALTVMTFVEYLKEKKELADAKKED
jgi:glycerol-3-phosphate acyltransferase PlsY